LNGIDNELKKKKEELRLLEQEELSLHDTEINTDFISFQKEIDACNTEGLKSLLSDLDSEL